MSNKPTVLYKTLELLTLRENMGSPRLLVGPVLLIILVLSVVGFFLFFLGRGGGVGCLRHVSCVPNVASVSRLSILDFPLLFSLMFIYSQKKFSTFEDEEVVQCLLMVLLVFNATFNDISVISWWRVLLVEETGVPGENHRSAASHWQTLLHNVVSSTSRLIRIRNSQL